MGDVKRDPKVAPLQERPEAEENLGLFFSPTIQGGTGFLVPMTPLKVGPGEPGPGDDWHLPPDPDEPPEPREARTSEK